MSAECRVTQLGLHLPAPRPRGSYLPGRLTNGLLFLAGHGPVHPDGSVIAGVVGEDVDVELAREAARLTGLHLLGSARAVLGSLDRIAGVVNLLGMVRARPDFEAHPTIIDGCSDLLLDVLGDDGRHARAAIGVASLPFGMCVEITAVLSVQQ
jgi:enamine deaminase RidA (YjgF/YER057c/UK114 family)